MATKNRVEGIDAVIAFILDARLPFEEGKDTKTDLTVSAKAGDKWRLTKVPLPVEFRYNDDDALVIHIPTIASPFYRSYREMIGTYFVYDIIKAKLFIEGNLNKGRGDPYVICVSR